MSGTPKGLIMRRLPIILIMVVAACSSAAVGRAETDDVEASAYWSHRLHEENSIYASILYFPYGILRMPVGLISAFRNPRPTTQAVMPPAAHTPDPHP
jgi:hypothetical protein